MRELIPRGRIIPVRVEGGTPSEIWYAQAELDAVCAGMWHGRSILLSPFDDLVSDRRLTRRLWDFDFRNEMYIPKAKCA
ncbi:crosslink repair DNA glycosylase YcaQ family protein [Streptomyces sp. NPDC005571]|uniref:DNA glycosylase AlkZ-like family protein n=1 Tax=Streptomyces sp. NPDC005571 TaxID=3156888 RepID=UPI0033A9D0E3